MRPAPGVNPEDSKPTSPLGTEEDGTCIPADADARTSGADPEAVGGDELEAVSSLLNASGLCEVLLSKIDALLSTASSPESPTEVARVLRDVMEPLVLEVDMLLFDGALSEEDSRDIDSLEIPSLAPLPDARTGCVSRSNRRRDFGGSFADSSYCSRSSTTFVRGSPYAYGNCTSGLRRRLRVGDAGGEFPVLLSVAMLPSGVGALVVSIGGPCGGALSFPFTPGPSISRRLVNPP